VGLIDLLTVLDLSRLGLAMRVLAVRVTA